MAGEARSQTGFYCSTSGTYFTDKESLSEHYKSDFHRYNLKRKVAGLPPVTHEWFEARKAQLSETAADTSSKIWVDPLTKKKFASENTYQAFTRSKKYQDMVKKSGQPAPAAVLIKKEAEAPRQVKGEVQPEKGFVIKPASKLAAKQATAADEDDAQNNQLAGPASDRHGAAPVAEDDNQAGNDDGWETASEDGEDDWEEWDVTVSLLDNHKAASFEANLEYMFKRFGFYFPDAQYLKDPEGLLRYLGAKMQHGRVALYSAGDDANAKQFRSLHAVQRHMVDTNQCKMLYEGNEEEYADYYDYQEDEEDEAEGGQLVTAGAGDVGTGGAFELVVQGAGGSAGGKVLGSREFLRYYRQRHRPEDTRKSVAVNTVLAQYRRLAISTVEEGSSPLDVKQAKKAAILKDRSYLQLFMKSNIIRNLPKNCTH